MRRRGITPGLVIVAALVALLSGCSLGGIVVPRPVVPPAGPVGAAAGERVGIATGSEIFVETSAQQDADFAAIASTHAGWVRFDVGWSWVQGANQSTFTWTGIDRVIRKARANGLKIIATLDYTPAWARPAGCTTTDKCGPATAEAFAAYGTFANAAAARYGANAAAAGGPADLAGSIEVWEIWNEPNQDAFWKPRPNLDNYVAALRAADQGIKAADPGATVITGGLAPAPDAADGSQIAPPSFVGGLYARGAKPYFDGVGHHPYAFPWNPLVAHPLNAFTQTLQIHGLMVANGDAAKKIWGTESGAPTGTQPGRAVTEAQQAQWVHDYYQGWNTTYAAFTGPLMWFQHRDSGTDPGDWTQNLGLLRRDGTPKPAYDAFRGVASGG